MRRRIIGLRHAAAGLAHAIRTERNMRIHAAGALLAVAFGVYSRLSRDEWLWVALAIALVWSAECFNTAMERAVDRVGEERHPLAKAAKDTAAAAVLVVSAFAVVVGALVLLPAFLTRIGE
ncbi:diacylglycerol kinase family protein [Paenibacillus sp. TRM 82003]|nr:diacylglycerol kinase family protein [Paenibacillus sp. TRM 82003]